MSYAREKGYWTETPELEFEVDDTDEFTKIVEGKRNLTFRPTAEISCSDRHQPLSFLLMKMS